jgi:hypothetical protein
MVSLFHRLCQVLRIGLDLTNIVLNPNLCYIKRHKNCTRGKSYPIALLDIRNNTYKHDWETIFGKLCKVDDAYNSMG